MANFCNDDAFGVGRRQDTGRCWQWLMRRVARRHRCGFLPVVLISLDEQRLYFYRQSRLAACYPVSTSSFGAGNIENSLRTPVGTHRVCELIGSGSPPLTVFKARRISGGRLAKVNDPNSQDMDLICARIIRLAGLEAGANLGCDRDSEKRNIYIHGTSDELRVGEPVSQGCVRMVNDDVIELFDQLAVGALVHLFSYKNYFSSSSLADA